MTHVIAVRNVGEALVEGLWFLKERGVESSSRNGRVLVSPTPVITEYIRPNERVLFSPLRDANPFFHLMESLWMLAGRNDVAFPAYYAANIASFSDDGVTIAGAYGERWRSRFGYDQLKMIIKELKTNPDSRRCVLSMWQPEDQYTAWWVKSYNDLHLAMSGGKDVPCNTQVYFDTLGGKLNITVTCRSNDLVWGAYGANAVHFSILHEYVALCTGIRQGTYRQFSNNYHLYLDRPDVQRLFDHLGNPKEELKINTYASKNVEAYPLISSNQPQWDSDLKVFFGQWKPGVILSDQMYMDPFFSGVAVPLVNAYVHHKEKSYDSAINAARRCIADDWSMAAVEWLQRRQAKHEAPKEQA